MARRISTSTSAAFFLFFSVADLRQVLEEVAAAVQEGSFVHWSMETDPTEAVPLTSPVGDCEEIDPGAVWPARFLAAACSVADCPDSKLKASNKFNGSLGIATVVAVSFCFFFSFASSSRAFWLSHSECCFEAEHWPILFSIYDQSPQIQTSKTALYIGAS